MTERVPKPVKPENILANLVEKDISFPKQSDDYDEISSYLEMEHYIPSMSLFDEAWQVYLDKHN
jgi:uncharacterized protein YozE (UPF0346 family)